MHKAILVVDDDDSLRDAICDVLEGEGFTAIPVANGLEALTHLRKNQPPCLILLDLMMPVMNGWDFLSEQAKDPGLAGIPVVILSASHDNVAPAVSKITKPVDFKTLVRTVEKYC